MRVIQRLVAFTVALVVAGADAFANPAGPNDFFEKNFVTGESPTVQQIKPTPSIAIPGVPEGVAVPAHSFLPPVAANGAPSQGGEQRREPRMRVTVYVSSKDKAHFETVAKRAFWLFDHNRYVWVSQIFHLGDYHNVSDTIKEDAKSRHMHIVGVNGMPPNIAATDSPTWVLRDKNGEHIVEGVFDIDKCIDKDGLYRAPERSMFEPEPTATVVVQGF